MIKISPHPQWVKDLIKFIKPDYDRVVNHQLFNDINSRKLSKKQFQGALINFYPLINSFPQYMALSLTKVPAENSKWSKKTRCWLINNIHQEHLHTDWWRQFAAGFGVPLELLDKEITPPPQMDAINNYLWRICTYGSLIESISAANFAVEGPTGEWTKKVSEGIKNYGDIDGIEINEKTLQWITAHAHYDDRHPEEALEIIKAYAITSDEQEKVKQVTKRALEYYALALDTCYELFK